MELGNGHSAYTCPELSLLLLMIENLIIVIFTGIDSIQSFAAFIHKVVHYKTCKREFRVKLWCFLAPCLVYTKGVFIMRFYYLKSDNRNRTSSVIESTRKIFSWKQPVSLSVAHFPVKKFRVVFRPVTDRTRPCLFRWYEPVPKSYRLPLYAGPDHLRYYWKKEVHLPNVPVDIVCGRCAPRSCCSHAMDSCCQKTVAEIVR